MIINCGNRRIVKDRYGFKIEIRRTIASGKREGEVVWKEDRPAFPNALSHALELVYERTLADENDEIDVRDLPAACLRASIAMQEYLKESRRYGIKQAAKQQKEK